jgi:hypothetical protein
LAWRRGRAGPEELQPIHPVAQDYDGEQHGNHGILATRLLRAQAHSAVGVVCVALGGLAERAAPADAKATAMMPSHWVTARC